MRRASAGMQGVPGMQSRRLRAAVPALSLFVLLLLGVVPLPVGTVASVEAQRCTPPAFWNPFGGGRCEVYMCAEGWTLDNNYCRKDGEYPVFAASCPVGWGVRAVDHGISGYSMRCVDPSPPAPPPPPLSLPSIPDFRVPSGGSVSTLFPAATGGTAPYAYSLSGLPPGITFAQSTRRATGTLPTVGVDTTYTITYSVTDNVGGTASVSFLTTVRAAAAPPPPDPSPPSPPTTDGGSIVKTGVNVSGSRTYSLTLSHRAGVSVELTGMTTDFDCTVSGNLCSNRGGTADDSWSGTLGAGEHKIVVYPYGGGSGNYTLTVSVEAPGTGGSSGTRTQVTTLVKASRTNISRSRTYSFTLARRARVDVALTGLTIDFDCRVGSSRCTNRWGTQDDSWSGDLAAGSHSVVVYPYDPGPGNYSLTVTATETLAFVTQPLAGGPPSIRLRLCKKVDGIIIEKTCRDVVIPGGEGNPDDDGDGDGDDDDGGDPNGGGGPDPADAEIHACYASSLVNSAKVTSNPLENDRALGSNYGGRNTSRPSHSGIDVRAARGDAVMTPIHGRVTETQSGHGTNAWDSESRTFATTYPGNGNFVRIEDYAGREHVFLHLHTVGVEVGDLVTAFHPIGTANNSGNSRGDHLHYTIWRDSSRLRALDPESLLAACE